MIVQSFEAPYAPDPDYKSGLSAVVAWFQSLPSFLSAFEVECQSFIVTYLEVIASASI
jgi:hypothetical protein